MLADIRMAELLCTRLCHDLTGPIGAVHNGAEFLNEEGAGMQNQVTDLIISSAHSAVSRLQFYRVAYGQVKGHGEAPLSERKKMAADFFSDSKITLDWPDSHTDASGVSVSLKMLRLIYNLLIVASSALIRGGTLAVRIGQNEEGARHIQVKATASVIKWDPLITTLLTTDSGIEDADARTVQAFLTRRMCDDLGAELHIFTAEQEVQLDVVQQSVMQTEDE